MNRRSRGRRADLLHLPNGGMSMRAAGRFTRVKPDAIVTLVVDAGWACLLEAPPPGTRPHLCHRPGRRNPELYR